MLRWAKLNQKSGGVVGDLSLSSCVCTVRLQFGSYAWSGHLQTPDQGKLFCSPWFSWKGKRVTKQVPTVGPSVLTSRYLSNRDLCECTVHDGDVFSKSLHWPTTVNISLSSKLVASGLSG